MQLGVKGVSQHDYKKYPDRIRLVIVAKVENMIAEQSIKADRVTAA